MNRTTPMKYKRTTYWDHIKNQVVDWVKYPYYKSINTSQDRYSIYIYEYIDWTWPVYDILSYNLVLDLARWTWKVDQLLKEINDELSSNQWDWFDYQTLNRVKVYWIIQDYLFENLSKRWQKLAAEWVEYDLFEEMWDDYNEQEEESPFYEVMTTINWENLEFRKEFINVFLKDFYESIWEWFKWLYYKNENRTFEKRYVFWERWNNEKHELVFEAKCHFKFLPETWDTTARYDYTLNILWSYSNWTISSNLDEADNWETFLDYEKFMRIIKQIDFSKIDNMSMRQQFKTNFEWNLNSLNWFVEKIFYINESKFNMKEEELEEEKNSISYSKSDFSKNEENSKEEIKERKKIKEIEEIEKIEEKKESKNKNRWFFWNIFSRFFK